MARLRTPSQRKAYSELRGRINQYTILVQRIYDELAKEVSLMVSRLDYDATKPFRFRDYPQTSRVVKDLQTKFVGNLRSVVYSSTSQEWKESNLLQDLLADKALKFYGVKHNEQRRKAYYQTNSDALKAFQQRKDKGLNLSQRLWNQSAEMKKELEYAISSAIQKGVSASTLSKRLSKYLHDFPSLKADYKERFGKAVDIRDCEYRSIRLARSEINMAYRTAEQLRWNQFDFVVGFEIKLSGSHPRPDICDDLKGKYPKSFKFTGWHPNCFCYCIPILKTEDEFWDDSDEPSENEVTDVPEGFKEYLKKNEKRIESAEENGTLPYFVSDNADYIAELREQAKFKMTDEAYRELKQRGVSVTHYDEYDSSMLGGFDALSFDTRVESVCDEYMVSLDRKVYRVLGNGNGQIVYEGELNGEEFAFSRTIRMNGDVKEAWHDYFVVPKELQGRGIGKDMLKAFYDEYQNMGVERITLKANMDIGGYAWARYGFSAEVQEIESLLGGDERVAKIINLFKKNNPDKKYMPMHLIANQKFGKEVLLNSHWLGILDLTDRVSAKWFERYIGYE